MIVRLRKSRITLTITLSFVLEILVPTTALALTSGPGQPETMSFQQAGASNMVDLFTGDFKYNVPLLTVGDYPLNLSYNAEVGVDDEASWVGLGWNLNPGAINRNMRGIPDDFDPQNDMITRQNSAKPSRTVSIGFNIGFKEFFGVQVEPKNGKMPKVGVEIFHNNYTGVGFQYNFTGPDDNDKIYTLGKISSNSQSGLSIAPGLRPRDHSDENDSRDEHIPKIAFHPSVAVSLNSKTGVNYLGLGAMSVGGKSRLFLGVSSSLSFAKPVLPMSTTPNTYNTSATVNIKIGKATLFQLKKPFDIPVHISKQGIVSEEQQLHPYGYMYMNSSAYKDDLAILDFTRQGSSQVNEETSKLPEPSNTYDVFSVTGQGVGGQFRFHRGSAGLMGQSTAKAVNKHISGVNIGFELGLSKSGDYQVGVDLIGSSYADRSGMWIDGNEMSQNANYSSYTGTGETNYEGVYAKMDGESLLKGNTSTNAMYTNLEGRDLVRPELENVFSLRNRHNAQNEVTSYQNDLSEVNSNVIITTASSRFTNSGERERRATFVNWLTADEASAYGFNKDIQNYNYSETTGDPDRSWSNISRVSSMRKGSHISEVQVTGQGNQRYIYGLPVYNVEHHEVSFSIGANEGKSSYTDRTIIDKYGIVSYIPGTDDQPGNSRGISNSFNSQSISPYTHSLLLTAVLSPEYEDVDQNGPTENDLGSYTKFNYSKFHDNYGWRSPMPLADQNLLPSGHKAASLNKVHKANATDDIASYSYGSKEIWYVHSIESKTQVALFYVSKREDGLSVDQHGNVLNGPNDPRLMKLDKIELYNKVELAEAEAEDRDPIPLKSVHFEYSYDLCPGVPNNTGNTSGVGTHPLADFEDQLLGTITGSNTYNRNANANAGKLTLHKVWFTYGSNSRGQFNPYIFEYSIDIETGEYSSVLNPSYHPKGHDRWGTYRAQIADDQPPFGEWSKDYNHEFPFVYQDPNLSETRIDEVTAWKLNRITIPGGARMKIEYEPDDYAYVQDQKAMKMSKILGFVGTVSTVPEEHESTGLYLYDGNYENDIKDYLVFEVDQNELDIKKYIPDDLKYLYVSANVLLTNPSQSVNEFEQIAGFYEVVLNSGKPNAGIIEDLDNPGTYIGYVQLVNQKPAKIFGSGDQIGGDGNVINSRFNPITFSAMNFMKMHRLDLATPGANIKMSERNVRDIAFALFNFIPEVYRLARGDYKAMRDARKAMKIDPYKSWVRTGVPTSRKFGGGHRVKSIRIEENMEGSKTYGVEYDYNRYDEDEGRYVSSGVASYEPFLGANENVVRNFLEDGSSEISDNFSRHKQCFYEIGPINELYYPGPVVGYSQVTTRNLFNSDVRRHVSGRTVNEFYTAKDFPVHSYMTVADNRHSPSTNAGSFIGHSRNFITVSQGFKIVTNNMHGKPKAVWEYAGNANSSSSSATDIFAPRKSASNIPLSGTEYIYFTKSDDPTKLEQKVQYLDRTSSTIKEGIFAEEIEVSMDANFSESEFIAAGAQVNLEFAKGNPIPAFQIYPSLNTFYSKSQTIAINKIVREYGILQKTIVHKEGATLESENIAFDPDTGSPLLVRTETQYNGKDKYSLSIPAHWVDGYESMGPVYKNIGIELPNSVVNDGTMTNLDGVLVPGDELIDVGNGAKYWVLDSKVADDGDPQTTDPEIASLVDKDGDPATDATYNFKIIRSGNTNHITSMIAGLTHTNANAAALNANYYDFEESTSALSKVLMASEGEMNDSWRIAMALEDCNSGIAAAIRKTVDVQMAEVIASIMEYNLETYDHFTQNMKEVRDNDQNGFDVLGDGDHVIVYDNGTYYHNFSPYLLSYMQAMNTGLVSTSPLYGQPKSKIDQVTIDLHYIDFSLANSSYLVKVNGSDVVQIPSPFCDGTTTGCCSTVSPQANAFFSFIPIQMSDMGFGGQITGMRFEIEAFDVSDQSLFFCNYNLNFNDYFLTWGIGQDFNNSFMTLVDDYGTNSSADLWVDNTTNTLYHKAELVPTSSNDWIDADAGFDYTTTEYSDFMDDMYSCYVAGKNALWQNIITTKHDGTTTLTYNNNSEYTNFTDFHNNIVTSPTATDFELELLDQRHYYYSSVKYEEQSNTVVLHYTYNSGGGDQDKFFLLMRGTSCDQCVSCTTVHQQNINPFLNNIWNAWTPIKQLAYYDTDNGEYRSSSGSVTNPGGTDITIDGVYENYHPRLDYNSSSSVWEIASTNDDYWQYSEELTERTSNGQGIESKSILNDHIRSSVLIGHGVANLPIATVQNSELKDIAYAGFEDYPTGNVYLASTSACPHAGNLDFHSMIDGANCYVTEDESHSGMRSMAFKDGTEFLLCHVRPDLSTVESRSSELLDPTNTSQSGSSELSDLWSSYNLKYQDALPVFAPHREYGTTANKKYVLSYWVKDDGDNSYDFDVKIYLNYGTECDLRENGVYTISGPNPQLTERYPGNEVTIDGWTKKEYIFEVSDDLGFFKILFDNNENSTVYIDDFRIYPLGAVMKSYVYHPTTFRLMAELDPNNFAVFYEYDEQGNLVRTKIETERGVMTVGETRQSVKLMRKD